MMHILTYFYCLSYCKSYRSMSLAAKALCNKRFMQITFVILITIITFIIFLAIFGFLYLMPIPIMIGPIKAARAIPKNTNLSINYYK